MKYSIGYPLFKSKKLDFVGVVTEYKEHISDVYFAWSNLPTGRVSFNDRNGLIDWTWQKELEGNLKKINDLGIKLNLLLSGSCYGADMHSSFLDASVRSTVDYLIGNFNLSIVTVSSPSIARILKDNNYPLEVKSSVVGLNVGTINAMEHLEGFFDSFIVQRDLNKNFAVLGDMYGWCKKRGKKLYLLANSGCLKDCAFKTYCDNCHAHSSEIASKTNIYNHPFNCHSWLATKKDKLQYYVDGTWINPADVDKYENLCDGMKLATRESKNMSEIIGAYVNKKFVGNLLQLLEPKRLSGTDPVIETLSL
jgi:hypothetical protein